MLPFLNPMMNNKIRIASTVNDSIVDGPGLRFVIFTQGCLFGCFNCHNIATWDVKGGALVEMDDLVTKWRKNPLIEGITLSGGDPLLQPEACLYLIRKAHETGLNVTLYSGDTYERLLVDKNEVIRTIIQEIDYLIDGPFVEAKKDLSRLYRGSYNQRFIDLGATRRSGILTLIDEVKPS